MLADIASGNTGFADVMFLVALVIFVLGGALAYKAEALYVTVLSLGLACVALAWLVL